MGIKKNKITFAVPENLKAELSERVIKDGYGFRGKSLWAVEAINYLLELPNFTTLVNLSSNMSHHSVTETVVVDLDVKRRIDEAVLCVRKEFPTLEGVQSNIIRTAIMQRLLRKNISSDLKLTKAIDF